MIKKKERDTGDKNEVIYKKMVHNHCTANKICNDNEKTIIPLFSSVFFSFFTPYITTLLKKKRYKKTIIK